jgi:hypothetical protein
LIGFNINCCEKTVVFSKPEEKLQLMSEKEVVESLKVNVGLFAILASLMVESGVKIGEVYSTKCFTMEEHRCHRLSKMIEQSERLENFEIILKARRVFGY